VFLERRKKQRIACHFRTKIVKVSGEHIEGEGENLSIGGVAIRTSADFFCGEKVMLHFSLYYPEIDLDTDIEALCKVSHVVKLTHPANTAMVGLQFHDLSRMAERSLKQLVDHLSSKAYQRAS
jgi:c-di-GMP-binding flagellar brake protein YcgR